MAVRLWDKNAEAQLIDFYPTYTAIFQLGGSAAVSSDRKVIDIEMKPKEPEVVTKR